MQTEASVPPDAIIPEAITPEAINEQLQRLLESSHFTHSRRYPSFLRYVVDQSLKGQQDQLKERTIGVEVFGRTPAYDLNVDPVVRVTAGEVRKRLAQYYYESEHRQELRIELHPGSYIPEFKLEPSESGAQPRPRVQVTLSPREVAPEPPASFALAPLKVEPSHLEPAPARVVQSFRPRRWLAGISAVCFVLLAAAVATVYSKNSHSAIERLWQPVWSNPAPVLISIGSWGPAASSESNTVSIISHAKYSDPIALSDATTFSGLQQLLSSHAKSSIIQTSDQTSFADLQRGTTILISGFDNRWTQRLTDPLRYHFVIRNKSLLTIEDRQNPGRSDWQLDNSSPYSNLTRDYAIIARFHDPTTEQTIVVAAGIGENGTLAAGQVLASEELLESAGKDSGLMGPYHNVEAVIETQVIDGKSGPPRIVAITFW